MPKKKIETITQEEVDALPPERNQGTWLFTYTPESKKQAKALRLMFGEMVGGMLNGAYDGPVRIDQVDDSLVYAFIARYDDRLETDESAAAAIEAARLAYGAGKRMEVKASPRLRYDPDGSEPTDTIVVTGNCYGISALVDIAATMRMSVRELKRPKEVAS